MQRLAKDDEKGSMLARIAFYAYMGSLQTYPVPNASQQAQAAHDMLGVILGYLDLN